MSHQISLPKTKINQISLPKKNKPNLITKNKSHRCCISISNLSIFKRKFRQPISLFISPKMGSRKHEISPTSGLQIPLINPHNRKTNHFPFLCSLIASMASILAGYGQKFLPPISTNLFNSVLIFFVSPQFCSSKQISVS